ncbi:hydantoinase B/oxoprolinase family protein [Mesorhizobium xinjiangense]|uniref:hydantoinase B/oxoprolinase family protein n=1 Tax=Mesorhizobium xinjiangense TaxID=2678685 RepID=UPI0012EE942A|nr:hydantoinase B/oxoprolinase family protein [Mesorhizobium xinjiangense]
MTASTQPTYRIGFDIGGTFTDFILHDGATNRIRLHKLLTTPHDPSVAALQGLTEVCGGAGIAVAKVSEIIHGTTLVTNAVIERKGAKLGLVTTRGFRDILEMGREQRYDIYDMFLEFPDPLAPRDLRLEVDERIDRDGNEVAPLDEDGLRRALETLVRNGCEAVAISFINAYRNSSHERRAGEIAAAEFPELAVSLSAQVVPEMGEYPRTVTTCANAYVQPLMDRYLTRLESALAALGFDGELRLMHSAGGLVSPSVARAFPIRLLESGPAGGGLAAALFGETAGKEKLIAFDMGGTTAKACIIEDGRVDIAVELEAGRVSRFRKGSGLPMRAPVIDMIEIGAGGGSIAGINSVGLLKVGPQSAGSDPGPVCYGLGGTQPTVTDADMILGYYDPDFFLGGRMNLDLAAAEAAMDRLAEPLGLSRMEAARGVHRVVVESMAAATRVHMVEKGKDPRDWSMVGFGGAGPAHAADVARVLGVREVIVPPASGAASALGFLTAPLSFEISRSMPVELTKSFDAAAIEHLFGETTAEAKALLTKAGVVPGDIATQRFAEMRLVGQMHEITVPLPADLGGGDAFTRIRAAFTAAYEARYASVRPEERMEAISFRVLCSGPKPGISLAGASGGADTPALKGYRRAWFDAGEVQMAVYDRYALMPGTVIDGPAVIEERESTTLVPLGDRVEVDASLNLRIAVATEVEGAEMISAAMSVDEAIERLESDPVSLEIMWSRLVTVTEEMWLTVIRTAFSLTVSESQDFACGILDIEGKSMVHSPRAMPVFNLTLPRAVRALLAKFPAETLKPGDVLITNDPWLCAGHLFDIAVVTPVFVDGRIVALIGTVGHVSDIGGTKNTIRATEIYEEGLQIPPMKFMDGGRINETLVEMIATNVREPEQVVGDIHGFIAANTLGADRLTSFMSEYGLSDLRGMARLLQGLSEKAMRDAVRRLPDGEYRSEIECRQLGDTLRYPVKVTVAGDEVGIDFEGAPPQLPRGGLNSTLNYTVAHATYPLKCILTPEVRGNAGCYRAFRVNAPARSSLNPDYPASVSMRTRTGWYLAPVIFRALSQAAPGQVQAHTGLPIVSRVYCETPSGIDAGHMFLGGGQGGSNGRDGKSALLWPTSASNTAVEVFEARVPVLVTEKAYLPDSGGAGAYRGGLGQRLRMRKLYDDGLPMQVGLFPEAPGMAVEGLFGGAPGSGAAGRILDAAGNEVHDVGDGELVRVTTIDRLVEISLNGGSGYGHAGLRDPEAVAEDIRLGYVTKAAARSDYPSLAEARQLEGVK